MKKVFSLMLLCLLTCSLQVQAGRCLLPTQQSRAKTYIVAVGVADYPGTVNDLQFCDADARVIASVYSNQAGATTKLLTNSQATRQNILSALETLFSKATQNDIIIFFFSGHGSKGAFEAYDGSLKYNSVFSVMKKSRAKTKCILADACYAGKARTNTQQRVSSPKNIMLFLSSRSNETSLEIPSMKHGLFAYYLEKALKGQADTNRDRVVTAVELFNYVSRNVGQTASREYNHQQHPVMWGNFPKSMVVVRY